MATKFILKQHDLEPPFEVQLLDEKIPVDLTSAVGVLFLMKNRKGLKASGAMDVGDQNVNSTKGVVSYTWVLGDTDTAGTWNAEVQVTWPGGRAQTFPADQYLTVEVQKDLGP